MYSVKMLIISLLLGSITARAQTEIDMMADQFLPEYGISVTVLHPFYATARGTELTGFSAGTCSNITSSDSILTGFGKAQCQSTAQLGQIEDVQDDITSLSSAVAGKMGTFTTWPWASVSGKPSFFSGNYGDLSGLPSLFSGAYADLTGKPVLFSGAYGDLSGRPNLATVALTGSYTDLTDKPSIQATQRIRAQTNASGVYVWSYPTAYSSGTVPVISLSVEDGSASSWDHQITAISNTSVTIQLVKVTPVTILGISVLGVSSSPQAYVHLTATSP